jgi:hypothetical protein
MFYIAELYLLVVSKSMLVQDVLTVDLYALNMKAFIMDNVVNYVELTMLLCQLWLRPLGLGN